MEVKYDTARQYYIRFVATELEDRELPELFINVFQRKGMVECQTLQLCKLNQKITDSHNEVIKMSDKSVQDLIEDVGSEIPILFKVSEAIAMLDMLSSFAHTVTMQDYIRPELTDTLAIKAGRHPIHEKIHLGSKFIPNDVYATDTTRFQILTGCNMSGKSTYIRSVALMTIMAQAGCFVPAQYASFPIRHQLFARVSTDDSVEANVSTFAAEMRETAFILRNIDERSIVIIDELGRGTSTRDGLAIALAIAEALVESQALVWFVTHFRDLATILSPRPGVVTLHLAVELEMGRNPQQLTQEAVKMKMLYKIAEGIVAEEHYGLALARVVTLPPTVLDVAHEVSARLTQIAQNTGGSSRGLAVTKKRKLVLSLREQLRQASDGTMERVVLSSWLQKLQDEFVVRMASIETEFDGVADEEADDSVVFGEGGTRDNDDEQLDLAGLRGRAITVSSTGK